MPTLQLAAALDIFAGCQKIVLAGPPHSIAVYLLPQPPDGFVEGVATKLKEHYLTAKILERWGRKKLAAFLTKKTPASLVGKSGDLGEILATEMINAGHIGSYAVPINRLRWKDSKELPMRGDDLIGVDFQETPVRFLKGEAKSRKKLSSGVLVAARKALEKNKGLPMPHTLAFLIERLYEQNEDAKAEALEPYVVEKLITPSQVAHLVFTFSGNDPTKLLTDEIEDASKVFTRTSVGVRVEDHPSVINQIFTKATTYA